MNYGHEFEEIPPEGNEFVRCTLCGRTSRDTFPGPCPERIVQEVVRRLKAELQHVNVVPAKRKDRP